MDQRAIKWFIEFVRLFGVDKSAYLKLANDISESRHYDYQKKSMIQSGIFKFDDVITHAMHNVFKEDIFSRPQDLRKSILNRMNRYSISTNVRDDLRSRNYLNIDQDVWLNDSSIKDFIRFDCIDNAILGIQHIIHKYTQSICHIEVKSKCGDIFGGTGFIVRVRRNNEEKVKLIITNRHVIDPKVWEINKIQAGHQAIMFSETHISMKHDLAAIEIEDTDIEHLLYLWPEARILEQVVTVGFPFVARVEQPVMMFHLGQINGITETIDRERLMFMSAAVSPGSSGGPVLNELGMVVGVTTQSNEGEYQTPAGKEPREENASHKTMRSVHYAAIPSQCLIEFLSTYGFKIDYISSFSEAGAPG